MNLRTPLIYALLHASRSAAPAAMRQIRRYEYASRAELEAFRRRDLESMLIHAYRNVPYYNTVLHQSGVVVGDEVRLEHFDKIPLLTKEIIRREGVNLHSRDAKTRKPYENTSGGSTGEPVTLIQDKEYADWNIATTLYFNAALGKHPGEREIKFWGSDRDILAGNLTIKDRLINLIYNRRFVNSYRLGEHDIQKLIKLNNSFKPVAYWAYMESALELSRYLAQHDVPFRGPQLLISTIGPLTEEVRGTIEAHMHCKVYNQYGSREVGAISCQCTAQQSMHTFPWWNYIEIRDKDGEAPVGQEGLVIVTTLRNYSMPLIRYEIGDVAVAGGHGCDCGRNSLLLKTVLGRTLGYFRKNDGSLVHSHFLVQALFFRTWIKRFQIIQDKLDHVIIRVERNPGCAVPQADIGDIISKVRILMGKTCDVEFQYPTRLERSASGKFLYTICRVS